MSATGVDYEAAENVNAMVKRVRDAGLAAEASMFETVYWGWLRTISAYVCAHPYVRNPEAPSMTPISALSVTDSTIRHWSPLIPGTPPINDAAVLAEAAADEAWHRREDLRMRREASEPRP